MLDRMRKKRFWLVFLYIFINLLAIAITAEHLASLGEALVISNEAPTHNVIAGRNTCGAGGSGCNNAAIHQRQTIQIGKVPEFVPTNEWKEILPNQGIPVGIHVRMNLATGKKEGKLIDPNE